jgi:glycosyltransferase involved in cell wall biosynthesis
MDNSTPRVSVVLPVYNGADYIAGAIASIQAQTLVDWELIIVDDGSKDGSLEECRRQVENDSRIRIFSNETNLGLARTMNRAVHLCRADYIAVQEQDDISTRDRLRVEAGVLDARPSVGIVSGIANWIDEDGRGIMRFPGLLDRGGQYPSSKPDMVRYLYVDGCKVVNAGCMFRGRVIEGRERPFAEHAKHAIDWRFFLEAAHEWEFFGVPDTVVHMRRGRNHKHLTKHKSLLFSESRRCLKEMYQKYRKQSDSPITLRLYAAALANQLVHEGRYYGGIRGVSLVAQAIACNPLNGAAWQSLSHLCFRRVRRVFATAVARVG